MDDWFKKFKKLLLSIPNSDPEVADILSRNFLTRNPHKDTPCQANEEYQKLTDKRLIKLRKKQADERSA